MTPVRSKRGKHSHVTLDVRKTICSKPCNGWIVGGEDPSENPESITCPICRDFAERRN